MTQKAPQQTTIAIASFFKRLETLGPVVGIIMSEKPVSALITLRGRPEKKVMMDFSARPPRVAIDGEDRTGHIFMTIDGNVLHGVLLGRKDSGVALGRREMIVRGSAHHLSRFIPLFDFSPVLYRQHLSDIGSMEETMTEQVFKG
ncbi:MAG: hypothetical protein KKC99_03540, partial [Proteobacteria bacterium]|nr:hypothetical protein [Pseudomonadota bacterium]